MTDERTTSLDNENGRALETDTDSPQADQSQPATSDPGAAGPASGGLEPPPPRDESHDRLLRLAADFDNYRKRVERERRDLHQAAATSVILDLLPLVDDLERALRVEASTEEAEAYRQGFDIIYRQFLEVLRKRGVRPIDAVGAEFDPTYHEAVAYEPSETHKDGEIIGELRRGYMIGDRLLRPSMVRVAKA